MNERLKLVKMDHEKENMISGSKLVLYAKNIPKR